MVSKQAYEQTAARENRHLLGRLGQLPPLLPNAASAPWRPSHAGAGDGSHKVVPKTVKFGGCSPPLMRQM